MENKEGFGAIFRNNNKQSDKSPDYTGAIMIEGKEVKLSCWVATSKLGVKYLSLRVANSLKQAATQEKTQTNVAQDDFVDDDIPWN